MPLVEGNSSNRFCSRAFSYFGWKNKAVENADCTGTPIGCQVCVRCPFMPMVAGYRLPSGCEPCGTKALCTLFAVTCWKCGHRTTNSLCIDHRTSLYRLAYLPRIDRGRHCIEQHTRRAAHRTRASLYWNYIRAAHRPWASLYWN